jgi:long-chain acyl-CoA synthetase
MSAGGHPIRRPQSLSELLPYAASVYGEKVALSFAGRSYSFQDLDRSTAQFANALRDRGVRAGERVSICGTNSAAWIAAYHGTLRIGACVNPINAMLTKDELGYILKDCQSVALCAAADKLAEMQREPDLGHLKAMVCLDGGSKGGASGFDGFIAGCSTQHEPAQVESDALSTICYTSGTTGRPKGAMQSHRAVLMNAQLTAMMHGRTSADTVVTALPLPHVYGTVIMNAGILTGMTMVLHERFDEHAILSSIQRHRATMFEGVPAMYMFLLNHPELGRPGLQSLRLCTVGGQTMPVGKMRDVEERFGCQLTELWGMTEIAGLGATFSHYGPARHGSIGVPLPYVEAKVVNVDDARREQAPGDAGELLIRGPIVMQGYFNDKAATAEAIDPDGWLHTGDIACRGSDGYLTIVDRKKDLIVTAGYNVYPAEIERVLADHPMVALAAVGSIPDEVKGELAKAYIIPMAGATPQAEELIRFCRERLAAYKVPRAIEFVTDLPRTSTGKIMRRALRSAPYAKPDHAKET